MRWDDVVSGIGAVTGGALVFLFGGWDMLLSVLICLIVLDVVTGFIRAGVQGKLSSDVSYKGILRKVLIFAIIAVAAQVDKVLNSRDVVRSVVAGFYCGNEGLSILENAVAAGLPVPEPLRQALENVAQGKFQKEG